MVKMTGGGCQKSIPIERITIPTVFKIGGFFADKLYMVYSSYICTSKRRVKSERRRK